jgi:hypothetical protein
MKNKGLNNPAVAMTLLQTPQGQKMIENAQNTGRTATKIVFTFGGLLALYIVGRVVYNKFFSFSKIKQDKNYTPANITEIEAEQRANAIETALQGVGSDFQAVEKNLSNINRNAFILIYNAFGERRGYDLKKLTLIDWLVYEYGGTDKLSRLRLKVNGFF